MPAGGNDNAPVWPDEAIAHSYPIGTEAEQKRWQAAIDKALDDGSLELVHQSGHDYNLVGSCPRCSHAMGEVVTFSSYVFDSNFTDFTIGVGRSKMRTAAVSEVKQNVICSCTSPKHAGPKDASGCGWGEGLSVTLKRPGSR